MLLGMRFKFVRHPMIRPALSWTAARITLNRGSARRMILPHPSPFPHPRQQAGAGTHPHELACLRRLIRDNGSKPGINQIEASDPLPLRSRSFPARSQSSPLPLPPPLARALAS